MDIRSIINELFTKAKPQKKEFKFLVGADTYEFMFGLTPEHRAAALERMRASVERSKVRDLKSLQEVLSIASFMVYLRIEGLYIYHGFTKCIIQSQNYSYWWALDFGIPEEDSSPASVLLCFSKGVYSIWKSSNHEYSDGGIYKMEDGILPSDIIEKTQTLKLKYD